MSQPCFNIMIVDDHEVVAYGIAKYLNESFPDFSYTVFTDGLKACFEIERNRYDLFIIDLELKNTTGFELIKKIRSVHVLSKIIVCTMHEEIWYIKELHNSQVNGIILKSSCSSSVTEAVTEVLNGNSYYCERFNYLKKSETNGDYSYLKDENVTDAEYKILFLIGKGYTSKMIGEEIGWSVKTVEHYRKRLFDKFGVSNVSKLVAIAMKEGFLKKDDI